MKVLTKELRNDLELHEIYCALESREKRTIPLFFFNGSHEGIADNDIKTLKTNFNLSDRENELSFMLLPDTFMFFYDYFEDAKDEEMRSPENDFMYQYLNRLRIISHLPEKLLKKIKDKRLLALGYADKKVKKDLVEYLKAKKNAAFKVLGKSIENSLKTASGLTIEKQFKERNIRSLAELLKEKTITGLNKKRSNLYIKLDDESTFVLTDVKTLEKEINPINTYIDLFELHKVGQGYELHFLLMTKDSNLIEYFHYVTYRFNDMMFSCF